MKFIILACLLGFSAASFLQDAAPAVDDSILALWSGMAEAGSLREALDMPDAYELDAIEDDMQTELGKLLKQHLDDLLEKINDHISSGKIVAQELLNKLKELKEKMKGKGIEIGEKANWLIEKMKENAKDYLKKLLERLGLGKRDLGHLMEYVADWNFQDLIQSIKEKILSIEFIEKIREYIANIVTNNPVIQAFKEAVVKMRNVDIRELLKALLDGDNRSSRGLKDLWERIKNFFDDLNLNIKKKHIKFLEWAKETMSKGIDKFKEKHGIIKDLAKKFIEEGKSLSRELFEEGLDFFKNYKGDLGELFDKMLEIGKNTFGQ